MATTVRQIGLQSTTKPSRKAESVRIAELPILTNVWVGDTQVHFDLEDGRSVVCPLSWSPLLMKATPEQRRQFSFSAYHVFWDDLDEIIGIKNVLYPPAQLLKKE